MLNPLDVIVIFDSLLRDPHPKMMVCVEPAEGWFYRINSRPFFKPNIALPREPDHPFLHHDSYIHCDIIMLDDYIVDESLRRHNGPVGQISRRLVKDIVRMTIEARFISLEDGRKIRDALAREP